MTEEEKKWEEEHNGWWQLQPTAPRFSRNCFRRSEESYLEACRKRQEEIERLKKYKGMWLRLKDQLRRDREQGHTQKTARAWLLMQEYEEAK